MKNTHFLIQFLLICSLILFLYWIAIVFDCFLKSIGWKFLYGFVGVCRIWAFNCICICICICIWMWTGVDEVGVCLGWGGTCIWLYICVCIWDVGVCEVNSDNYTWFFFNWDKEILDVGNLLKEWSSLGVESAEDWFYAFFFIKFISRGA